MFIEMQAWTSCKVLVSLVKPFALNPKVKPLLLFSLDPRSFLVFQVCIHTEFKPLSISITLGAAT